MNFFELSRHVENYKDIDPEREQSSQGLNMTAGLPHNHGDDILASIHDLTRGFHLNTIIGRLFSPWRLGFSHAPIDYENPENAYRWCISREDRRGNDKYKAAYDLFKKEIASAVAALPYKTGFNVSTRREEDVMRPTKEFLKGIQVEEKGLIESMRAAYNIYSKVFGRAYEVRSYINFFEIVRDEFMKIGEKLPTMGEDDGEVAAIPFVRELEKEIERYRRIERGRNH